MPTQEQLHQFMLQHLHDTISAADKAYLDSINSLPPIEEPTIADDIAGILTCTFIIIAPFLLIGAIARIRRGLRMRRDPAYRAKQLEDMAYIRRMQSERQRQAMSPEERQLRNIYWLLFWQGLSGRHRRK